jgi:hypothetical protein
MLDLLTWTPGALFLGIVGILLVPFLGVLVVLTVMLGALVVLAGAIVMGSYELAHAIGHRWRSSVEAAQPAAAAAQAPRAGEAGSGHRFARRPRSSSRRRSSSSTATR